MKKYLLGIGFFLLSLGVFTKGEKPKKPEPPKDDDTPDDYSKWLFI